MSTVRIAVASTPLTATLEEAVPAAVAAVEEAGRLGARIVCLPETGLPGHRGQARTVPDVPKGALDDAVRAVAGAARRARVVTIVGTERPTPAGREILSVVLGADGTRLGEQVKTQIDPSEESHYVPGTGRRVFTTAGVTFGIAICHEAFRYPEIVRSLVLGGAQVVFVPHFVTTEDGSLPDPLVRCHRTRTTRRRSSAGPSRTPSTSRRPTSPDQTRARRPASSPRTASSSRASTTARSASSPRTSTSVGRTACSRGAGHQSATSLDHPTRARPNRRSQPPSSRKWASDGGRAPSSTSRKASVRARSSRSRSRMRWADPEGRHPPLPGAEEVAGAADLEVLLRDREAVLGRDHDVEARPRHVGEPAVGQEDAGGRGRPAPDAAPQLVELRQAEALGVLDRP